jgi:triphosphoribosyl-dephospho-CoA synthase
MFSSEDDAAIAATLSMLLEVSGNPKSGNVDREHDFPDLRYEHFLASAASAYPVFRKAALRKGSIGGLVLEAVKTTRRWHSVENVHFGAFLLLMPLVYCWKEGDAERIAKKASETLKETSVEDSLAVLQAFKASSARVMKVERFSLDSDETAELLVRNDVNLYDWMLMAPEENLIARELTNGFEISLKGKKLLTRFYDREGDINTAIVLTYHTLLSEYLDALVISKHGRDVAEEVRGLALKALKAYNRDGDIAHFKKLDDELIKRGINPGTIADLTISSIFLAFAEGLRL